MCAGFFGGHQERPEKLLQNKKSYLPTVPAPIIPIRIVMLMLLFPCSVDFTGAYSVFCSRLKQNNNENIGWETIERTQTDGLVTVLRRELINEVLLRYSSFGERSGG